MTRARSVAEFVRDVQVSKAAQRAYRMRAAEIDETADMLLAVGDRKRHNELRRLAFVARNAARAEFFDPEPVR